MSTRRVKFTDSVLRGLKPTGEARADRLQDVIVPTLRVRENKDGTFSYVRYGRFKRGGSMTRRAIGAVGRTKLAEARKKAREWDEAAASGIDPAEEVRKVKAARAARLTVNDAVQTYFKHVLSKHRTGKDSMREMRTEVLSRWGDRALEDVTRKDVVKMMEQIAGRGAQRQAANIYGVFRTFCNWCLETDRLQASPCAGIKPRRIVGELRIRTRVLNDDELRAVWKAAEAIPYPYGPYIQLLLWTGARKSEASDAAWSEFDLEKGTWVVPEERFKSGVTHRVPLSRDAVALLTDLPRWEGSDLVFSFDGKQLMNGHSKSKGRLDAAVSKILGRTCDWQIHDLRRTVRTRLASLGVADTVAEQIIGHGRKGLARVYDQHQYTDEMRDALEKWARKLRSIIEPPPDNVSDLAERRRARA